MFGQHTLGFLTLITLSPYWPVVAIVGVGMVIAVVAGALMYKDPNYNPRPITPAEMQTQRNAELLAQEAGDDVFEETGDVEAAVQAVIDTYPGGASEDDYFVQSYRERLEERQAATA